MSVYRLQTVMEIRQRAEDAAKQAFSEATRELFKERTEQKRLEDDLERRKRERKSLVQAHFEEVMAKGAGANGLVVMNRFENRLKDEEAQVALEIERQKEVVGTAEEQLEVRRLEMAEASRELKAIEKHRENWQDEIRRERDMKEELNQEEIGSALHLARQRK